MTHAYILGDSLTGFRTQLCARMGWTFDLDAVSGSGYTHRAPTHLADSFGDRLPALIAATHDVIVVAGGSNDNDSATFAADVAAFYADLRADLPTEPLYVTPTHRMTQAHFDVFAAIVGAAEAVLIDWGDCAEVPRTDAVRWLTGTGNVAAPAGDGNRDDYMSDDGIHPSAAGSAYLGDRMARAILSPFGAGSIAGVGTADGSPIALGFQP